MILLCLIAVALVVSVAYIGFYLPKGWRNVALGMSRAQVIALIGTPTADTEEIKGCLWYQGGRKAVHMLGA